MSNTKKHDNNVVEVPVCDDGSCSVTVKKKSGKDFNLRPEKSPLEKAILKFTWVFFVFSFLIYFFLDAKEGKIYLRPDTMKFCHSFMTWFIMSSHSGAVALIDFLSTHLVSAMVPAFFLAAAISTFFSKETIILAIGKRANPLTSYPLAAFAGAILTVCSCGVLPLFMSLLQSGAGLGPSITFLFASPAINLISVIYTWKILPNMLAARIIAVAISGIFIGFIMDKLFKNADDEFEHEEPTPKETKRTAWQEGLFFLVLVLVMLTSTDAMQFITKRLIPVSWFASRGSEIAATTAAFAGKITLLGLEIILTIIILRAWFTWNETRKWLKRTYRQGRRIIPMVVLGVFFSGFLGGMSSIVDRLDMVADNSIFSNLLASVIGSMLYFGSIVGVNVVDLFRRWGMNPGPSLALLLAGPAISLPSVLALMPIMGKKKTFAFLILVVIFSASFGLLFGALG